jgi:hypothetical protein
MTGNPEAAPLSAAGALRDGTLSPRIDLMPLEADSTSVSGAIGDLGPFL